MKFLCIKMSQYFPKPYEPLEEILMLKLIYLIMQLYISVTPKMVKNVIMNLDLSNASGPDCIPVVVLRNCEPELSYILDELFSKCLQESYFPDFGKVSSVVHLFKNVGERSRAKNYCPVSLLSVSKVFEKLVNNRIFAQRNVAFF